MQTKTKKRTGYLRKSRSTRKQLPAFNTTKWPYYSSFLSKVYVKLKVNEMVMLEFKTDNKPYTPILFTRKTPAIPITFKGQYVRFIDAGYLEYDVLPLVYSEPELLKCQFRKNLPAITNFNQHRRQLLDQFRKSGTQQTIPEFREFLFQHVKQCNNFRPTLALQLYDYLGDYLGHGRDKKIESILDFSAGWGDRLFSAAISGRKYIGLDPNVNNRRVYTDIIAELGNSAKQRVITTGAEYLDNQDLERVMADMEINKFDLIFTSPPYYDYEIYSRDAQSITNYSQFETWLTYFLFYVILKYVHYLHQGGYVGIYIQDADNKTYLEPLALFVLANSELLGLTVSGIISATRYPMIIFQKVGANNIFPFINKDRQPCKKYNKGEIMSMYKKAYPAIFRLNTRLRHIYAKGMMGSFKMDVKYGERDISYRAMFKWVINLDVRITGLVMIGSLDELSIILATVCKDLDIKFSALDNSGVSKLMKQELITAGTVILDAGQAVPVSTLNQLVIKHAELRKQLEPFIKETKNELAVIQLNN